MKRIVFIVIVIIIVVASLLTIQKALAVPSILIDLASNNNGEAVVIFHKNDSKTNASVEKIKLTYYDESIRWDSPYIYPAYSGEETMVFILPDDVNFGYAFNLKIFYSGNKSESLFFNSDLENKWQLETDN